MSGRLRVITAAAVCLSLLVLYGSVLDWYTRNSILFPADTLETLIMGAFLIRLAVALTVPRVRRNWVLVLDMFSVEMLLVPILVLASISLGHEYLVVAGGIIDAWVSAFLLVFPAFAIFKVGAMMYRNSTLPRVLASATGTFALLVIVLSATTHIVTSPGLAGMTDIVAAELLSGATAAAQQPGVSEAGTLLYLGLVVYSTLRADDDSRLRSPLLVLPVLGTASALTMGVLLGQLTSDSVLLFGAPALLLLMMIWLVTRRAD